MKSPSREVANKQILKLFRGIDSLKATDGYAIFKELAQLNTNIFIYRENYRTLRKNLKAYHSDMRNINNNSVKRWRQQRILIKDFHNVLTSVRTYVEQHEKKVNYLNDPFHCFMKELRNFIIHKQALPLISNATAEDGKWIRYESFERKVFEIFLDDQIQKHPTWSGLIYAKKFLFKCPNKVPLNGLLEDYDKKITSFHVGYFLDKVKTNLALLSEFAMEVTAFHRKAREWDMTTDHPITEAQLRHLNFLINKSKSVSN